MDIKEISGIVKYIYEDLKTVLLSEESQNKKYRKHKRIDLQQDGLAINNGTLNIESARHRSLKNKMKKAYIP